MGLIGGLIDVLIGALIEGLIVGLIEEIIGGLIVGTKMTKSKQTRETLQQAGYELVKYIDDKEVLLKDEFGTVEVWQENNDAVGYTIEIGGKGYTYLGKLLAKRAA